MYLLTLYMLPHEVGALFINGKVTQHNTRAAVCVFPSVRILSRETVSEGVDASPSGLRGTRCRVFFVSHYQLMKK